MTDLAGRDYRELAERVRQTLGPREWSSRAHAALDEILAGTEAVGERADKLEKALAAGDQLVSAVHDAIYAEPFDRKAASDAVWRAHEVLRAALERAPATQGDGE